MDSNDSKFFNLQKSMPYARNDNKGRTRAREKDRGRKNSRREKSVIRARIDQVWVGRETGPLPEFGWIRRVVGKSWLVHASLDRVSGIILEKTMSFSIMRALWGNRDGTKGTKGGGYR